MDFSHLLNVAAEIVVAVVGPIVAKQVRDREVREAIKHAADAALVLAIRKTEGAHRDVASLVQIVVDGILDNPTSPKQVRRKADGSASSKALNLAERAAAAAIARNSVGLTSVRSG